MKSPVLNKSVVKLALILVCLISFSTGFAQIAVRLPYFFGDNMVLQRQKPIKIWGTASPRKSFEIEFTGVKLKIKADASGNWKAEFPAREAGGPYEMKFLSDSAFVLKNILIGDVYLCSGQSNMEMKVFQSFNSAYELRSADNSEIRYFAIPKKRSLALLSNTLPAQWKITTPVNAATYSAVAWFFARNIHEWEKIPIGLIDNSWGGTPIEYWTSLESLATHPDYREKANTLISARAPVQQVKGAKPKYVNEEIKPAGKAAVSDKGLEERWYSPDYNPVDWMNFIAPGYWENQGLKDYDGVVWMRKEFNIPTQLVNKKLVVNLEIIDTFDRTYINGVEIGSINWAAARRAYIVSPDLIKQGKNLIAIRIENPTGNGGFESKNAIDLRIEELVESDEPVIVPLSGKWLMKPVTVTTQNTGKPNPTIDYNSPSFIYNAMVAPLSDLPLKGILWYQGETNSYRAYQYRSLFPLMINDWRRQFQQGDLPFLFVQLAGYMALTDTPVESYWAELREAQAMALSLPRTGMVVTLDVGNPYDVHPTNKQEVGRRLAMEAEKVVYGKTNIITSPLYRSMKAEGNTIRLSFTNAENGLIAKNGPLKGFAIAGEDKKFVWAKAEVQGKEVVVWNDQIKGPVAVRYAWTSSPVESNGANLYNSEGFPASPFRTDEWPGMTVNNK